jgi:(R,R)-butanediol dehydrogenase/meso-butanediol dehydrogenase/diacetyl reductase/L-iditol 2-dehydrogenase
VVVVSIPSFEASGNLGSARQSLYLADKCGTIVWAAVYAYDKEIPVNPFYMYVNELSIRSGFIAPFSFPRALAVLPKLDLDSDFYRYRRT